MLEDLADLFKSDTIKPTFENVHVILALFIFEENINGIGRYRLEKELLIGSGTAKSLIKRLNEKINFISVLNENIRKGHVLTEKGLNFVKKIKQKIPFIMEGDISILQDTIIDSKNVRVIYCLIKNSSDKLTNGIEQRDAAIKVGGLGATCLVYDGQKLIFPSGYAINSEQANSIVDENIYEYFEREINSLDLKLEMNDVIIIGLDENLKRARLAAVNAALTLFWIKDNRRKIDEIPKGYKNYH